MSDSDERLAYLVWAWGREFLARIDAGDARVAGASAGYLQERDGSHTLVLGFPPHFGEVGQVRVAVNEPFFYAHMLPLLASAPPPPTPAEEQQFLNYWGAMVQWYYPMAALEGGAAAPLKGLLEHVNDLPAV